MTSPLEIQPDNLETIFNAEFPDTTYSTQSIIRVSTTGNKWRGIGKFDFSALPNGATITAATLDLNYFATYGNDAKTRTYWIYELTQTAWVEAQATWNSYTEGSAWAAAGGDYNIETNKSSLAVPASFGWMSWNVLALIQHCQSVHSKIAHFLIKDGTEGGTQYGCDFHGKRYTTDPTLCPKLIITYIDYPTVSLRKIKTIADWNNRLKRKEI